MKLCRHHPPCRTSFRKVDLDTIEATYFFSPVETKKISVLCLEKSYSGNDEEVCLEVFIAEREERHQSSLSSLGPVDQSSESFYRVDKDFHRGKYSTDDGC